MRQMERRRASECCFNYQVLCSNCLTEKYEFPSVGYMPFYALWCNKCVAQWHNDAVGLKPETFKVPTALSFSHYTVLAVS